MSIDSTRMKDSSVVVIGGSSGMGLAIAKRAAGAGARVTIAARDAAKLDRAAGEIGANVDTRVLDATDEAAVAALFADIGAFDHLVTSASAGAGGPIVKADLDAARGFFESKFWGQFFAARHAAPHIRETGSITLFSGGSGRFPSSGLGVEGAVNGAVEAMCRALAQELAPVRVNVISPGLVDTPIFDGLPPDKRQKLYQAVAARLPVGRVGHTEDIAEAALFLMNCGFSTGSVVDVDGGFAVRR